MPIFTQLSVGIIWIFVLVIWFQRTHSNEWVSACARRQTKKKFTTFMELLVQVWRPPPSSNASSPATSCHITLSFHLLRHVIMLQERRGRKLHTPIFVTYHQLVKLMDNEWQLCTGWDVRHCTLCKWVCLQAPIFFCLTALSGLSCANVSGVNKAVAILSRRKSNKSGPELFCQPLPVTARGDDSTEEHQAAALKL